MTDERVFINVVWEERCFGGHEEGGWYYTKVELFACELLSDYEDMQQAQIKSFKKRWAHLLEDPAIDVEYRETTGSPMKEQHLLAPVYE